MIILVQTLLCFVVRHFTLVNTYETNAMSLQTWAQKWPTHWKSLSNLKLVSYFDLSHCGSIILGCMSDVQRFAHILIGVDTLARNVGVLREPEISGSFTRSHGIDFCSDCVFDVPIGIGDDAGIRLREVVRLTVKC
jgi:hypothetical protein